MGQPAVGQDPESRSCQVSIVAFPETPLDKILKARVEGAVMEKLAEGPDRWDWVGAFFTDGPHRRANAPAF